MANSVRTGAWRRGFTLIEILVAVTLSMLMMAAAWNLFSQTQRIARRAQARLQLHASAKSIYESLRRDLSAMQQDCALWMRLTTNVSDIRSPGFELVFMTAVTDESGFQVKGSWENVPVTDLVWCRWRWDAATSRLLSSRNLTQRTWTSTNAIDGQPANPAATAERLKDWTSSWYWPQPRRFTAGDALTGPAGLDGNAWNFRSTTGTAVWKGRDLGDWSDLGQRLAPACIGVTACTIQLVQTGSIGAADSTVGYSSTDVAALSPSAAPPVPVCLHGIRTDGVASANVSNPPASIAGFADEMSNRPTLLRIAFTLRDAPSDVSVPFSFSFALPGLGFEPR